MATDQLPALPVGEAEVVWHDPAADPFPPKAGKIIDASLAFFDTAQIGDRLFTREQAEAIQREAFEAGKRAAIAADRARAVPEIGHVRPVAECFARTKSLHGSRSSAAIKLGAQRFREQVLAATEQPADLSGQAATAAGERGSEDRKAAEHAYVKSAFDYVAQPIGSRDWCLFFYGWKAARASLSTPASGEGWVPMSKSDLVDDLVAISAFVCDGDDRAAQALLGELIRRINPAPPSPTSPTEPAAAMGGE